MWGYMNGQIEATRRTSVIDRLVQAMNEHDLEALVDCFDEGYLNETPVHPHRGFRGNEQVRQNWTQILAAVPDLSAQVLRMADDGNRVWTEWDISGIRRDGALFQMAGVAIFGLEAPKVTSARFYLEPVEQTSGDVNTAISRMLGVRPPGTETPEEAL
ncbi:MAG: nuclear transport factor 2 family protein [Actinomycetota bacterium]|nr:nuclear transport factor 2 family protein [Actinomycetota bacterium]